MIRVLHVLDELRASGAEVGLQRAGDHWEAHGICADVVATATDLGAFAPSLADAGYRVRHLPFTGDLRFLLGYMRLVRSGSYDVVHVQMERASVYLCLAARLAGAKVTRTVRNCYPFEGRLARRRQMQRWLARAFGTRFVAISESVAVNEWTRFRNPTLQINNWVDGERFHPPTPDERRVARQAHGVPEGAVVVATVGNCSEVKNHMALLEALAQIDDRSWMWLHVGDEDDVGAERQHARDLGVAMHCRFLGRTDPRDALHAADLFVMPSLWEGLGMATVEALSTGLPVLLTDVPGNRDLAHSSEHLYWSGTDVSDLAASLRSAFADIDPARTDARRQAQHEAVLARYGLERGVAAYATLYRDLIRGGKLDGMGRSKKRSPQPGVS